MSKKRIFYIAFFTFLVVGFFITLSFIIPGFSRPSFPPLGQVQPFAFQDQNGSTIAEKNIQGKVVVVNFFFTACKSVCPRMNNNLKPVYEEFVNTPGFFILSHTCDPERDSVQRLKRYADSMKVDTRKWMFLTGTKEKLYTAARQSYKIDDPKNFVQKPEDDFLHTQFVALVNKKGEVVKIYDGIKPSEMRSMANEIQKLLKD